MIKNKIISLTYKTILLTISFLAIYHMMLNITPNTLAYFTNLSNILVFVIVLIIWIRTFKDVALNKKIAGPNPHLVRTKGIATVSIAITGIIYSTTLAKYDQISNYTVQNLSVHYIIPLLTVLDYFLFDQKGFIKWYHPLIWAGIIILYLPYIFIRALIIGENTELIKYPYFFLNIDNLGVFAVVLWCIGIALLFIFLSYLIYIYDRWQNKRLNQN